MGFGLNRKGSISIEFILLIGVALIYINGVVWPIANSSSAATADVKAVADTKIAAMKLGNAINQAAISSGEMKKTVQLMVPKNSKIACSTTSASLVYMAYVDYMGGWNPDEINCTVYPSAPADPEGFECQSQIGLIQAPDNCIAGATISGPILRDIVVKKNDAGDISVEWAT